MARSVKLGNLKENHGTAYRGYVHGRRVVANSIEARSAPQFPISRLCFGVILGATDLIRALID
jgi:hypothetical protein